MSFLWPAGLGFLALLPLVVVLYFLKLHRLPKIVSSTYLWRRAVDAYRVNRPFKRFQNSLLLWLQLLALLLAILALSRPCIRTEQDQTGVHIYLVDHSASMSAREGGKTRLELAKDFLRSAVRGKRRSDRAALIAFSDRAFVASPLTREEGALLRAIDRIPPTFRPTSIEDAWSTALSIARQFDESDIYLVSDGGFGGLDQLTQAHAAVHYVPVGRSVDNLGIVHVEARKNPDDPAETEIFSRVFNRRAAAAEARVELYLNDALADAQDVRVGPGEQKGVIFRRRGAAGAVAEVRIPERDDFAADNRAWVALDPSEPARVLLVGEENVFLQQGLANDPNVALERLAPETHEKLQGGLPPHDLLIFDGISPRALAAGTYLFLGCVPPGEEFSEGKAEKNPVLVNWDRRHPLARFVNFSTLHVARVLAGKDPPWMRTVLNSDKGPVISAGERGGLRVAVVRFALLDSDWPLRISFPLFLSNVVRWARGEDPGRQGGDSVRPGRPLTAWVPPEAARGTVRTPDGRTSVVDAGGKRQAVIAGTEIPGPYRVQWEGERREAVYSVNLADARESDIAVPPSVRMGDMTLAGVEERMLVNRELTMFLVLAVLACLVAEWFLYQLQGN